MSIHVTGVQPSDLIFVYITKWSPQLSLVNIHHHDSYIFFLVMRIFKICSLSNFKMYNTVLLTIVTILYIVF